MSQLFISRMPKMRAIPQLILLYCTLILPVLISKRFWKAFHLPPPPPFPSSPSNVIIASRLVQNIGSIGDGYRWVVSQTLNYAINFSRNGHLIWSLELSTMDVMTIDTDLWWTVAKVFIFSSVVAIFVTLLNLLWPLLSFTWKHSIWNN